MCFHQMVMLICAAVVSQLLTSKNVSSVLSLYDYHNVFIHNKKVNINIFFLFIEAGMSSNGFYSLS